jgi:dipeptidyl-peptidase-4
LIDGSGAITDYFTLAPGENRHLLTYRTHVWISRDARRRCLAGFVSEQESENWEIASTLDGDYERKNVRSFPVYVAPEFGSHHGSLLEQCLEVLDSNVKRIEDVIPSSAWRRISRTPIWLEYEPDWPHGGAYFSSREWLAENGMSVAKARSIQFASSLAAMVGSQQNPLMHELAHAYHDLVLSYFHPQISAAFERARASGRYNAVRHSSGRWERAYAMKNPREFFAMLSEAYFGTSDSFPFTRDDLKAFDPDSYRVISEAWERPSEETSRWPVRPEVWRPAAPK